MIRLTRLVDPNLPGPSYYVLNELELVENGFPVPSSQNCDNYYRFPSKATTELTKPVDILAVDCEMARGKHRFCLTS